MSLARPAVLVLACAAMTTGCATANSISHARGFGDGFYSGVRLDLAAINGDQDCLYALSKRDIVPPANPGLDLPFSLVGDTLALALYFLPGMARLNSAGNQPQTSLGLSRY